MPSGSFEDLGGLGEFLDLSLLESGPKSLEKFVRLENGPAPVHSRVLKWFGGVVVVGLLGAPFALFLNGYRLWHINQENPQVQIPYQKPASGSALLCYIWGVNPHVMVEGRSGSKNLGQQAEKLPKKLLFLLGGCKDFVPADGNNHIMLYFEDAASAGWGLYKKG